MLGGISKWLSLCKLKQHFIRIFVRGNTIRMKKKQVKPVSPPTAGITKQVIVRAARKGVREAAVKAMQTAGYVVKAEGGNIVQVDANGKITVVKKISGTSSKLILD